MKYMGSKRRLAKYIAPIIQGFIESAQAKTYIEPFVGGANMIEHIKCENRYGLDINSYLIEALEVIATKPHTFPDLITEDMYNDCKDHKDRYDSAFVGYVGFAMSFGGKFFGGYRRDKAGTKGCVKNMETQSRRSKQAAIKQQPLIADVKFYQQHYKDTITHKNAVIYCDPPYQNTTKYKCDSFNHIKFWQWCQIQAIENTVLVSEYVAPSFCTKVIWQGEINSSLTKNTGSKKAIEKLFLVN